MSAATKLSTGRAVGILAAAAGLATLVLAAPPAPGWAETAPMALDIAGYASALCLVFLALVPLRIRQGGPRDFLPIRLHRRLGYLALGLAVLHGGLYLALLPQTLIELTPNGSGHMLGALLGTLLLAWMIVISLDRYRRRLHRSADAFRAWHIILSSVVVLLVTLHIAASALLVNAPWKTMLWSCGSALALLAVLRPLRTSQPGRGKPSR